MFRARNLNRKATFFMLIFCFPPSAFGFQPRPVTKKSKADEKTLSS